MTFQQWKFSSEKPTRVHDATHPCIPTTQETNSSERESTVPTTIVTPSEIIAPLHLMIEDRECLILFSLTVPLSLHILLNLLCVFFCYDDSFPFLIPHFLPHLYFYIVLFQL